MTLLIPCFCCCTVVLSRCAAYIDTFVEFLGKAKICPQLFIDLLKDEFSKALELAVETWEKKEDWILRKAIRPVLFGHAVSR